MYKKVLRRINHFTLLTFDIKYIKIKMTLPINRNLDK